MSRHDGEAKAEDRGHETEDSVLLRAYAEEGAETAFAELVRRHLDFVYACALRRVGNDAHLAEDVSQQVFRALADKAALLAARHGLSGWLFVTTRNLAVQLVRSERRRQVREQEASIMNENSPEAEWERLRPVLDEALDGLSDDDRTAVLMRFYEGKPFAEVGVRLRVAENAARMRVERALDKMRVGLARRGVTSTGAALGLALANHAGVAAPSGLVGVVTGAALAKSAAVGVGGTGVIGFMSTTKFVAGLAMIGAIGAGLFQYTRGRATNAALTPLRAEYETLRAQTTRAEARAATAEARRQALEVARVRAEVPAAPAPTASRPGSGATPRLVTAIEPAQKAAVSLPPTLDATKAILAQIQSRIGEVKLEEAHIANIRAWVKQDPEGVVRWVAELPVSSRQREHTLEAVIAVETETNPELAFMLANSIAREMPRSNRMHEVLRQWAERDSAAAAQAVAQADLAPEIRARMSRTVEMIARMRAASDASK